MIDRMVLTAVEFSVMVNLVSSLSDEYLDKHIKPERRQEVIALREKMKVYTDTESFILTIIPDI